MTRRTSSRRAMTRARREDLEGRALVLPTVLVIVLSAVLPLLAVLLFAFTRTRLIDIPRISLNNLVFTTANFTQLFASPTFRSVLVTTVVYAALTTVGALAVGTTVALVLRRPFRGRGLVRALVLVPYVLPVVASATIWKQLLNPQYGLVNAVGSRFLGWDSPIAFLSTQSQEFAGVSVPVTLLVVTAFEIWKTAPLVFLFVTARLQVLPHELEEAGAIDGAGPVARLRHLILPQLRAVLLLLLLLRFVWSFQSFNDIYLLTHGAGGTEVLAVRVYSELITKANIGSASAYGLVMTAVLLVLLTLYFLANRRKDDS